MARGAGAAVAAVEVAAEPGSADLGRRTRGRVPSSADPVRSSARRRSVRSPSSRVRRANRLASSRGTSVVRPSVSAGRWGGAAAPVARVQLHRAAGSGDSAAAASSDTARRSAASRPVRTVPRHRTSRSASLSPVRTRYSRPFAPGGTSGASTCRRTATSAPGP